ncbi:MmgE/PrpD family protein [Jatrophihabitans sp. DSM 45814]
MTDVITPTQTVLGQLANWAASFSPTPGDLELAQRALADTVAVAVAAPALADEINPIAQLLTPGGYWATMAHILDFDDLHVPSTTHISAVCVPATLAVNGDARAYLAGAGVMARLGTVLGWSHYTRGWHATCTIGAPGAAVAAAVALGLSAEQIAHAIALSVPAAGGVQRAFGTQAKALQVGFAVEAGIRAARLAAAGATASAGAVDQWLDLMGGEPEKLVIDGPTVPGGLAIKLAPCCYAMQRPIDVTRKVLDAGIAVGNIVAIRFSTPRATVKPLIYSNPTTGLEAKFSLEYSIASALLTPFPGFAEFTDAAAQRTEINRLMERIEVTLTDVGDGLLAGEATLAVEVADGSLHSFVSQLPPGAPDRPPNAEEFFAKLADCSPEFSDRLATLDWVGGRALLEEALPVTEQHAGRR